MSSKVLVTGASGYVAAWVTRRLLEAGYQVRGTVRSLKNADKVKPLRELCPQARVNLELVEADLMSSDCWNSVVMGCDLVHHIASPFPATRPSDPDELIRPAREGTLNVLRACAAAKCVKRVVLTSSVAAVQDLKTMLDNPGKVFTENDWMNPETCVEGPYEKSKVIAEKAAWDYVKGLQGDEKFELAVINPGLVMGPPLTTVEGTSCTIMKYFLAPQIPFLTKLKFPICDVRDVASAHMQAMTSPAAVGHRHIIVTNCYWFMELADMLRSEFKPQGYKIPSSYAPYFLLKLVSCFDGTVKQILPSIGVTMEHDNSRMRNVLGVEPTPMDKTLIDMGYAMIEKGMIPKTSKFTGPKDGHSPTA